MAKVIFNNGYPDFSNFYYGPLLAFKSINPYLGNTNLFTPTTYPPFIFWTLYPLTLLSQLVAEKLWTIGSIISLLISLKLIFSIYEKRFFSKESLILSSLAFLSFPVKFTLGMGQINIYILLLIVLFMYFLNKSKSLSGIFLGISLMIKFFPIAVISYLIKDRKWKTLSYALLTMLIGGILTLIFINSEIISYFVAKIVPTLINSWKGDYYNQSLTGLIVRAGIINNRETIRSVLEFAIAIPTLFLIFKNKTRDKFTISLTIGTLITLNLLINSFSWQHHFVWLLPSFIACYFLLKKIKAANYLYWLLFLCYLLVSLNLKYPLDLPLFAQSHVFFGAMLLLILQLFFLQKAHKK